MSKQNWMSRALVALALWGMSSVAWSQAARPQTAEITVVGLGAVLAGDMAAARDKAIDDAMRKAVQQALGTNIKSETLVQNFQMVEDRILAWSAGYVSKYDILREGAGQYDTYEVEMRAQVNLNDLKNDDNALAELLQKENPRVMVMIGEQNIGYTDRYHYFEVDLTVAETTIIDAFRNKGFEVIDPGQAKENQNRDQILAALEGDSKAAAAIAVAQQAELIITGKAIAKVAQTNLNLGGMKSCQANMTAKVVRAGDARIIATATDNAAHPHIDEVTGGTKAIEKTAKKVGETLLTKVVAEAQKNFYNENSITVQVQGHKNYGDLQQFVSTIKFNLRGLKNVYERNTAGGVATLDLKILGTGAQLARELANKDLAPFTVDIVNVSPNRVDIKIKQQAAEMESISTTPDSTNQ
ncbi:hypothetical protein KJ068_11530 [bacterium]|nr:hypothetical protein [bacterium]